MCVAWSPDGNIVASGGWSGNVYLWDVDANKQAMEPLVHDASEIVKCVVFGHVTRLLASSSWTRIMIWELPEAGGAKVKHTLRGHAHHITRIALSPDDTCLVSASIDKTVRVWDATLGLQLKKLTGHTQVVCDVVWSRDGQYIVSGSSDKTVLVWQVCHVCTNAYEDTYKYHIHTSAADIHSCRNVYTYIHA
jgi:WD40 repeat protein